MVGTRCSLQRIRKHTLGVCDWKSVYSVQKKIEVVVERERDESKSESESVQRRVVHTQTPLIGAHSMCEVYRVGLCKPLSLLAGSYNSCYNRIIMGYFSIISGLSPLSPDYCSITDKTTVLSSEQLCLALQCQRTYPLCTTFLLYPGYTFIKVQSRSL